MRDWIVFDSLNELNYWESKIIENFKMYYKDYEKQFFEHGIQMLIQPCFCHYGTQRYSTHRKNSGSFLAFKIKLYPTGISYSVAKKEFLVKEFISHKVVSYKKIEKKTFAKSFAIKDGYLILFLKRYLQKTKKYICHNKEPCMAIKETPFDVVVPLIFIFRYRAEIKLSYRGHSLELYFIILIAILILIGNIVHYRAQHPTFN